SANHQDKNIGIRILAAADSDIDRDNKDIAGRSRYTRPSQTLGLDAIALLVKTDEIGYFAPNIESELLTRTIQGTTYYINIYIFLNQLRSLILLKTEPVTARNAKCNLLLERYSERPISISIGPKRTIDSLSSGLRRHDSAASYDIGKDRPRIATRYTRTD
ncbi:hypothetical protein N7527_005488, partial [Penicillium freii]